MSNELDATGLILALLLWHLNPRALLTLSGVIDLQ